MRGGAVVLLMAACASGAMALREPLAEANASRRVPGTGFAPKPALAKLVACGQRSTTADLLWLSAIGDLSREFADPNAKRSWLDRVFAAITTLEPAFESVYSYGSTYLSMIDHDAGRAIALLEQGVARNPRSIRLAVELAMTWYVQRHDREKTLAVLEKIVRDPECDAVTMGFYSSLRVDSREDFAALAQWETWLDHPNELVRETAQLQQERVKRRIALRAIGEYATLHEHPPRTRDDLRDPALMAPEVMDVVLAAVWIDAAGKPRFERCDELEQKNVLRGASRWVAQFHAEHGRAPTFDELLANRWVRLPPLPAGKRWEIVGDEVGLVDDSR